MLTSIRESRTCVYGARKNYFMYDILSYCIAQIVGTGHFLGLWKISEMALSFLWIFYYYFRCIFYLHVYLYTICMSGACRGPKRTLDPLELDIEQVVSFRVVASYQTPVF